MTDAYPAAAAVASAVDPLNFQPNCPPGLDRTAQVYCSVTGKTYPSPASFDNAPSAESDAGAELFARAPWLDYRSAAVPAVINRYVVDGYLPGGLPIEALSTRLWGMVLAVRDEDLWRTPRQTLLTARSAHARLVYRHIRRYSRHRADWPDQSWDFDVWAARYTAEFAYADRLSRVSSAELRELAEGGRVSARALFFPAALLPREFRFLRKRHLESFQRHARNERRLRSRTGYIVPYQHGEITALTTAARDARYIAVFPAWRDVEVPKGFHVELPSVLTLVGAELYASSSSGWWVIFWTEYIARVAVFLLWDLYDNYRVWALSPTCIAHIRSIDLSGVLGGASQYEEVLGILNKIEAINWAEVSENNRAENARRADDRSPGRTGPGGDFEYCDPYTLQVLSPVEARQRADAGHGPGEHRTIPVGHPTGHEPITAVVGGWTNPPSGAAGQGGSPPPGAGDEFDHEDGSGGRSPEPAAAGGWVAPSPGPAPASPRAPRLPRVGEQRGRSPSPLPPGALHAPGTLSAAQELETIRSFLLSAGFEPEELEGDLAELRGYVRAVGAAWKRTRR